MTFGIGGSPGTVYTERDVLQGKCPAVGHVWRMVDSQGVKEFMMCKVGASQNLTNGLVVTINRVAGGTGSDYIVVVAPVAAGVTAANTLGVAVCSATASASMQIWVQIFGRGNVAASLSALPNIALKIGSVAGNVDDDPTVSASAAIEGIVLLTTSSTAGIITACMLTYPRFAGSPANA